MNRVLRKILIPVALLSTILMPCSALASEANFSLGKTFYNVDNANNPMDAAPYIKDGRFFVPVRYTALVCGIDQDNIAFDSNTQRLTLVTDDGLQINFQVGKKNMVVNDSTKSMDVAPENIKGRVYLPIRYIAEALNRGVTWHAQEERVSIQMEDYLAKALKEIKMGSYPTAISLCEKMSSISPNSAPSHTIKGLALSQQGNYEGAIASYTKSIGINPNNPLSYIYRAEARWQIQLNTPNIDPIINDISQAIDKSPTPEYYCMRAGLYNYSGAYDKAIIDCNKAIALDNQYKTAYYRRAFAYCLKEGNEAFQGELASILNQFPNDEKATQYMQLLNTGSVFELDVSDWLEVY
ncbi:MAG: tetratricopeptide repeat protein [Syntrophomonadaceae bacterium]|nr:tetratricopeptide repeat protein [Syntrophomonadaceae bacterium]